jgi:hypothetical protein
MRFIRTYFALFDDIIRIWSWKSCTFKHIDDVGFTGNIWSFLEDLVSGQILLDYFTIEKIIIFFTTNLSANSNFRFINLMVTKTIRKSMNYFDKTNHNSTIRIIENNFNKSIQSSTINSFMH